MTTRTLDIYQIHNKRYVTPRAAADYLDLPEDVLQNAVYTGQIRADYIDARQFIDLDSLRAYAEKRRRAAKGWDRIDAFTNTRSLR